jgi:hypothetical protein
MSSRFQYDHAIAQAPENIALQVGRADIAADMRPTQTNRNDVIRGCHERMVPLERSVNIAPTELADIALFLVDVEDVEGGINLDASFSGASPMDCVDGILAVLLGVGEAPLPNAVD